MGFNFRPSEQELVHYAIQRVIEGPSSVGEGIFKECDLYAIEPKDLFQEAEGGVVYVFTKLKKKTEYGSRIDRKVARKGTWKEKDKAKTLYNEGNQIIGWRRGYAYSPNSSKSQVMNDQYRMIEYTLHNSMLSHAKFKDYVLCKIKKLKKKKKNKDGDEDMKLDTDSNSGFSSPDQSTPGTLSAPSLQPGPQLEESPINGDTALVELVPMSIENYQAPGPSFPCPVPLSCRSFLDTASGAPLTGASPSTTSQAEPALVELSTAAEDFHHPANGFNNLASAAPVKRPSPSTASQPKPVLIELPATKLGSDQQQATLDFPQPAYKDSASDAPFIVPSPSTELQPNPARNQSFVQSLNEDDYDNSVDWLMHFSEELRQFSQPLEDIQEVQMLPNPMALWNLGDMLFEESKKCLVRPKKRKNVS